ncbi:putative type I restriction-modification system specificity subunit [Vibrio coralliirubri]|uniref:restriction endonuclease subunit S n=1 Tax=Vibrio coralliirubri TaxID=1516159 RepID=UPI000634C3CE|nr:restriction endonuclease subunit S [Vibrio coralliirubri]CDU08196.1 putative type I restriction-modification system specificity subunit [Vibrio coralliirubri]
MSCPTVKLRELITLTGGFAFKSSDFQENGVPLIRIGNANSGTFKTSGMVLLPRGFEKKYSKFLVKPKDLLITLTGTVGKGDYGNVCEATADHDSYLLNQRVAKFNIESVDLFKRYLFLFLSTPEVKKQLTSLSRGVRQANIKNDDILELEIPLPPLEEQKRIAAILDKVDTIRQKRKQAIELADEFLRSVFLDMFGDPVTNPKGWEVTTCGEVFKLSSGKGLTAKNMDKDGSHLVYGGNGINGKHSEYMFEEPQLIIGRVGVYCGSIHITEKKSWVTDNAMYIKEYLKKVNIIFLAQLLDLANLNQYAGKAAQPLISGNRIYPLEMILPPIEEQERFAKIHRAFIENITKLHGGLESKSDLFQSLSQKAFSGQL